MWPPGLSPDAQAEDEELHPCMLRGADEGGEANTLKRLDESEINGDESGWLDMDFSRKYAEYVQGDRINAEVNVSQDLLDKKH